MKIEEQVCSLELAKKLKELGVKQTSIFYYTPDNFLIFNQDNLKGLPLKAQCNHISAFTVAELSEILPQDITTEKFILDDYRYLVKAINYANITTDNFEANAKAKMLIYLIKNKLLGG